MGENAMRRWVAKPWQVIGVVTLLCGLMLLERFFVWDIVAYWPDWFFYGLLFDLVLGALVVGLSCAVLFTRHDFVRILPLLLVVLSIAVWNSVSWDDLYLRLVWARHRQQYANIVTDLKAGRLVEGDHGVVLERTPEGLREVKRPEVWLNSESSLEPNVYFHVFGGSLLSGPMFGFLYAPQDEATLSREYWCGKLPDGWTRMKPHWYLVQD